jgi:RNA polymerase sigma-70 factor (ECF subfamily)
MVAGDREALAALYDRYAPALLALAQRLLRNQTDAEDLLHDFFIEVWQNAHSYDGQRGSVHSWLVVRLRSRALDRLKSAAYRRAAQEQTSSAALDELISPGDPASADGSPGLSRALALLSPHEQVLLELAYFEGYTLAEVAGRLSLPLGTVKSRLRRLLERLRRDLDRQTRRGPP